MEHGPNVDFQHCNGCMACYNYCPSDVYGWDAGKKLPTVDYPDECHYCGACELECTNLAIDVVPPLQTRIELGIVWSHADPEKWTHSKL